jgi:uncharacterized membrane protein YdjX (TVP38/TMEM64 family)
MRRLPPLAVFGWQDYSRLLTPTRMGIPKSKEAIIMGQYPLGESAYLMIRDSITNIVRTLKHNRAIQIGLVIIFIAIGFLIMVNFDFPEAKAFIRANRSQAALISIVIYFLLGFTLIPASPLTVFLAVFMGPAETVFIATVGNTLAAILEYHIGFTVGDVFEFETHIHKLPFNLAELPITSPLLLLAGRLLPLGKQGFSFVCGAYQVPLGKYLWTSVVMFSLNASVLAFTGAGLMNLIEKLINQI